VNPVRALAMGLLAAGAVAWAAATAPLSAEQVGRVRSMSVELGGASVHALCTPGPPEVLLMHSGDGRAEAWRPVLERLAGEVGACAYGRPVAHDATRRGEVRGWYELLDELRRLHVALGATSGYTLVGQGLGGMYARLYAADRPTDVGGLVFIDPAHEDLPEEMRQGMPPEEWEAWAMERTRPNGDGVRESDLANRALRARLPNVPVTVITATRRPNGAGWDERFLSQAARRVHASLLTGMSSSRHVPADGVGPDVLWESPDFTAAEILRVARLARAGRR